MDSLISVISELRKINSIIGRGRIELPQIVTVGSQSSGKSSVLEGIVGWDFLPRGTGVVTRRPLVLNLVNVSEDDPRRKQAGLDGDWATFDHIPGENFTNFEKVKQEIEKDTIKVAGDNKNISNNPIHLTIFSDQVIDLSLVDLPGAIRFSLPNQSDTIKEDIEKIIDEYIKSPKSLILAVTPANQDAAVSDALFYAKKYDPDGRRTLCVLTKLDIMDRGTDAYEMLTGKTIPVKLGIIGVRNRSQEEIANNRSIEECLAKEEAFFLNNYPSIALRNGMPYLRIQLNRLLINHIAEHLPGLRDAIDNMSIEQKEIMASLGEAPPSEEEASKLTTNKVIRNFVELFKSLLNGNQENLETEKTVGGARINVAFRDFSSFKEIKSDDGLSQEVVIHALRNSHGTRVPMFISEHCFIQLAIRQIRRLKDPSVAFVDTIKNILLEIVDYCTGKIVEQERNRFPRLYKRINKVACDIVNDRLQPTKEFVEKIVNMQINYINIRHSEFDLNKSMTPSNTPEGKEVRSDTFGSNPEVKEARSDTLGSQNASSQRNVPAAFNQSDSEIEDFLSRYSSPPVPPPPSLPVRGQSLAQPSQNAEIKPEKEDGNPLDADDSELEDCRTLQRCVIQYYEIVRNSLRYMLPKAIMMELVNHVKNNIHEELERNISALGDVVKELTKESASITEKRQQTIQKLEELERAKTLLQQITEVNI